MDVSELAFHSKDPDRARWPCLPRLGLAARLPAAAGRAAWFGRGPGEAYPDRLASTTVGRFASTVDALATPYLRPSESGSRADAARVAVVVGRVALGVDAGGDAFHFSAARATTRDLIDARHAHELRPRPFVQLNLDHAIMGVGGDDSWTACVHAPFLVRAPSEARPGAFRFRFSVRDAEGEDLLSL